MLRILICKSYLYNTSVQISPVEDRSYSIDPLALPFAVILSRKLDGLIRRGPRAYFDFVPLLLMFLLLLGQTKVLGNIKTHKKNHFLPLPN